MLVLFMIISLLTACPGLHEPFPPPPVIDTFEAEPDVIAVGGESTLSWSVSRHAVLIVNPADLDVSRKTSLVVAPIETTTYTLTAMNPGGWSEKETTVTVSPAGGSALIPTVSPASARAR